MPRQIEHIVTAISLGVLVVCIGLFFVRGSSGPLILVTAGAFLNLLANVVRPLSSK
jgi:hypothetical protein